MDMRSRHQVIISTLSEKGYVTVEELSKLLDVSSVTVRTDLNALEKKGILVRTHGGAMIGEDKGALRSISRTIEENEDEKKRIAKAASRFIEDGMTVIIDSGSTTVHLIPYLKDRNITVVTPSLLAFDALRDESSVEVIFLGGSLRRASMGVIGPISNTNASEINADIFFMGAAAYSEEKITSSNLVEADLKRVMRRNAEKTVFLADSSKEGKKSFASILNWNDIDVFVTDKISPSLKQRVERKGVELIIAE